VSLWRSPSGTNDTLFRTEVQSFLNYFIRGFWRRQSSIDGDPTAWPMMGRQAADQAQFFYVFNLDERIPKTHLLRRIDVFVTKALADVHREMAAFYSHTGRPSIDPELLTRMLIVGYCYGIGSERKLCEEVSLNLAYRWFCRLWTTPCRITPASRRTVPLP
jgi:hypothetical protein